MPAVNESLPAENATPNPPAPAATGAAPSRQVPWLTYAILALCAAVFGYLNLAQSTPAYERVTSFLVPSAYQIWQGAYWAFVITAFVHFGFLHFFFNMWWAKDFGKFLEPTMGRPKYLLLVLSSAVVGSGVQLIISSQTGVGYSGVLYALFGYALASRHRVPLYQRLLTRSTIQTLLGWLVLCIVLTATHVWNIANGAHIGGFLFGYCAGNAFVARTHVALNLAGLALLVALAVLSAVYMPWSPLWQDRAAASTFLDARRLAWAGDAEGQYTYGAALLQTKDEKTEGLSWLRKSAEQGNVPAMNLLAWELATATDDSLRNGTEALHWAQRACDLDGGKTGTYLDTLAAAYAELDRWDDAVATQRQAISLLPTNDPDLQASCQSRLEKYRKREKARE
jgi:GlpG protein